MQHTRPHSRRELQRQITRPSVSVDGVAARPRAHANYERRSNTILPATDNEYMLSLGLRASRQPEVRRSNKTNWRHFAQRFSPEMLQKRIVLRPRVVTLIALVSLLFIALAGIQRSQQSVIANQDSQLLLHDNGDTPHDKTSYNLSGYTTPADMPRLLTIRKLGIQARVIRLSARENSEPKSPQNIYDVGWYENSAKPGESGAALLIGHINGSAKEGVFHDLTNLVPGDEFQLELGDGTLKNYYVVKMEAYDRNIVDFNALMQSAVPSRSGLNLLTAVGSFESNTDVVQQLGVFAVEKPDNS